MLPFYTKVNIIFWGTSGFAIPTLQALITRGYDIASVVTNPDKPAGRNRALTLPPVKKIAMQHGLTVLQPSSLKIENRKFKLYDADLFIVAAYGKLIPREILDMPRFGALNIHPALLPRWRGPSPIQFTILNGDAQTGVTIIKMDERMDHGPLLAQREVGISKLQITNYKPTYEELHDRLAGLGAELLIETLPKWINGEITPAPQDESKATYSKLLTKADGRIDWSKPAEEIERMVRAFSPWPGTWTTWPQNEKSLRIRITEADWTDDARARGVPGLVWQDAARPLCVMSGRGSIIIKSLGIEGKRLLDAPSFIRGYPQLIGAVLY